MRKKSRVNYSSKISKRNKRRKFLKVIVLFLTPILVMVIGVLIIRAKSLQIKNIEIEGALVVNQDDIENTLLKMVAGAYFRVLPKSSLFLVDQNELEKSLLGEFSRLKDVSISKSIHGTLKVKLTERSPSATWCSLENICYLLDASGLVFARVSQADTLDKVKFTGVLEGNPILQKFGSQSEMDNYFKLIDILKQGELEVKALNVESKDKAVLTTSMGEIIFNTEVANIEDVGENVLLLIETERQRNPDVSFQYIDTRFGHKLFYKTI